MDGDRPLLTFDLEVRYEDGQAEQITVDQRDLAAYEISDHGYPAGKALRDRPLAMFRWTAWHALVRTKRTKLKWPEWTARAVAVDFDKDDTEPPDPGRPTAHAESS